jgi:hypothetical protein
MNDIDSYLVDLIGQLEKIRAPISCRQGQALANSIISGTSKDTRLIAWKEKHCNSFPNSSKEPLLGKGYWSEFMKQNSHHVTAKSGIKFDSKRADWCTYQNFDMMYREVYKEMVEGGIASKLMEWTSFIKKGYIAEAEEEAFGMKSEYFLLCPEKLLLLMNFENISRANDGNVGGEKLYELWVNVHNKKQI